MAASDYYVFDFRNFIFDFRNFIFIVVIFFTEVSLPGPGK